MLGLLSSISKFARMLFGPFWALTADKFGRKKVLILVTGVWGLWTIACGFDPNFTWLLNLYSVIGTVASERIINGLLPDLFRQSQRGKAYGTFRAICLHRSGCVLSMVSNVVPSQLNATAFAMLFSFIQGGITALMTLGFGFVAEASSSQTMFLWFVVVPYLLNALYWTLFYRIYPKDVECQKEHSALVAAAGGF